MMNDNVQLQFLVDDQYSDRFDLARLESLYRHEDSTINSAMWDAGCASQAKAATAPARAPVDRSLQQIVFPAFWVKLLPYVSWNFALADKLSRKWGLSH